MDNTITKKKLPTWLKVLNIANSLVAIAIITWIASVVISVL